MAKNSVDPNLKSSFTAPRVTARSAGLREGAPQAPLSKLKRVSEIARRYWVRDFCEMLLLFWFIASVSSLKLREVLETKDLSLCVGPLARSLLREYDTRDEIEWPILVKNGLRRCGREDAVPCSADTIEWLTLSVALTYHNVAEAALHELERRRATDSHESDGERHAKDEISRHATDAKRFYDVALSCGGGNAVVAHLKADAHELWALENRVALLVTDYERLSPTQESSAVTPPLVSLEGHAAVDEDTTCPWAIYEIQEEVDDLDHCANDATWFVGVAAQDCEWVAGAPVYRCLKADARGRSASAACPGACSSACASHASPGRASRKRTTQDRRAKRKRGAV